MVLVSRHIDVFCMFYFIFDFLPHALLKLQRRFNILIDISFVYSLTCQSVRFILTLFFESLNALQMCTHTTCVSNGVFDWNWNAYICYCYILRDRLFQDSLYFLAVSGILYTHTYMLFLLQLNLIENHLSVKLYGVYNRRHFCTTYAYYIFNQNYIVDG